MIKVVRSRVWYSNGIAVYLGENVDAEAVLQPARLLARSYGLQVVELVCDLLIRQHVVSVSNGWTSQIIRSLSYKGHLTRAT